MYDPIKDLENFNHQGTPVTPLSASEVRRRGDRMRRRNTVLATVGGVAAVILIATPVAVFADRDSGDAGPPITTQSPSQTTESSPAPGDRWLQQIPQDFPLTEGFVATNADGSPVTIQPGYQAQTPVAPCGSQPWSPDLVVAAVDSEQALYTGAGESGPQSRTLALYADEDAAREALDVIRTPLVEGCTIPDTGVASTDVASDLGDESLVYVDRYRNAGDFTGDGYLHQVVRVGNALFLASTYIGSPGFPGAVDTAELRAAAQQMATDSATVITELCLFSGGLSGGCGG